MEEGESLLLKASDAIVFSLLFTSAKPLLWRFLPAEMMRKKRWRHSSKASGVLAACPPLTTVASTRRRLGRGRLRRRAPVVALLG